MTDTWPAVALPDETWALVVGVLLAQERVTGLHVYGNAAREIHSQVLEAME